MTVLKPRSRMISVRLSDEEYLGLKQLCAVAGARSVSDLTRNAMRVMLKGADRDDVLSLQLDELRDQLKSLSSKIDQLVARTKFFRTGPS